MPKVSIITPSYNSEKTIRDTLNSIISQTFTDWELIVVNDASTDSTLSIIQEYANLDTRIHLINHLNNVGVAVSRNEAIALARGEWTAFLDSDDIWNNHKLERQLQLIDGNPDCIICYTATSYMDNLGNPYEFVLHAEEKTDYGSLLKHNIMTCSSVLVNTEVIKEISMPNDLMHEDYYVWLSILKNHLCAYGIDEALTQYRLSGNSKSSNRISSANMLYNTYRALGYNSFISCLMVLRYFPHSVYKRIQIKLSRIHHK